MTFTIAVTQQKGGVAKTTTAIHLAAGLARAGRRTLLVDLDPQAPAAPGAGVPTPDGLIPLADAIAARLLAEVIVPAPTPNLFVAPGDPGLDPQAFAALPNRATALRLALGDLRGRFDAVVIDTPPSLDLVTLNAVMAADRAVLPCDADAESVRSLERTFRTVRTYLGHRPEVDPTGFCRVVVTQVDARRRVLNDWLDAQLAPLGDAVLRTRVHRSEAFPKARANGETVYDYAARHPAGTAPRAARELTALSEEVLAYE
jgi:chromosome partitioning protein